MKEIFDQEGIAAFVLALIVAVIGWLAGFAAWVSSQSSMRHRMTTVERDVQTLKQDHSEWLKGVEDKVLDMREEVREDIQELQKGIKAVADRAEQRHHELMQALIPGWRK